MAGPTESCVEAAPGDGAPAIPYSRSTKATWSRWQVCNADSTSCSVNGRIPYQTARQAAACMVAKRSETRVKSRPLRDRMLSAAVTYRSRRARKNASRPARKISTGDTVIVRRQLAQLRRKLSELRRTVDALEEVPASLGRAELHEPVDVGLDR